MDGISSTNFVLDTTFLLPAFGVEIEADSSEKIEVLLRKLAKDGNTRVFISDLSPLEGFLKAFKLAERAKSEEGKKAAKFGFLSVVRDSSIFESVSHSKEDILNSAYEIRMRHSDPFDCFIFATAKALHAKLVTEDNKAAAFLGVEEVLSWNSLKKLLRNAGP